MRRNIFQNRENEIKIFYNGLITIDRRLTPLLDCHDYQIILFSCYGIGFFRK